MVERIAETDLYRPVADYLADQGYTVQGEVRQCDIAAVRGSELIIVELKLRLSAEAIAQAARRQRVADQVWVAIHKPPRVASWRKRCADLLFLLRRLELGLLLVSPSARTKAARVNVELPAQIFDRVKDGKLRAGLMREVLRRSGDFNRGGSVRTRVVSSYREAAVHIACCLERFGPLTVPELKRIGTGPHTWSILKASPGIEGWFDRDEGGRYTLNATGVAGLERYPDVAAHYRSVLAHADAPISGGTAPAAPRGRAGGAARRQP